MKRLETKNHKMKRSIITNKYKTMNLKTRMLSIYPALTHMAGGSLFVASLLLASCSSESTTDGGKKTDPHPDTPADRREVLLTLKNKLVLPNHTQRGIATEVENAISTLDVYVFGSATENGTYTFQERFAYRDDAHGPLPKGAAELQLNASDDTGNTDVSTALLKLKRGLFVKMYCVANDTALIDSRNGKEVKATDYVPLTLPLQPDAENPIKTVGVPMEADFLNYRTRLLEGKTDADILRTPLTMSGMYSTPLDLTDATDNSRKWVSFRLVRMAARFDVVNDAEKSHFTIQSIGMDNGRRGCYYFPQKVYGATPQAEAGELIAYTPRNFDDENANKGTVAGAFYTYPSPQADQGNLILRGTYQINKTESKEVAYRIPFTQQGADGTTTYLDINANHRYTLNITSADEYKLAVNFTVADWEDESIDDHDPSSRIDRLEIGNLKPAGETMYEPESRTVQLNLDRNVDENSFTVHTASDVDLKAEISYFNTSAEKDKWLTLEEITPDPSYTQHKGSKVSAYKVSLKADFSGDSYPQAILRISDRSGVASERVVIVPRPIPLSQPTPNITSTKENKLNRFSTESNQLYMYRVKGSTLPIRIICSDGIVPPTDTDWYHIEQTSGNTTSPVYTLTLTKPDVKLKNDRADLTFTNKKWPELKLIITVILKEAEITNPEIIEGKENAELVKDPAKQETKMTLKINRNSQCKLAVDAYDDVNVETVTYEDSPLGKPSDDWLEYTGKKTTSKAADKAATSSATPAATATTNHPAATAPRTGYSFVGNSPWAATGTSGWNAGSRAANDIKLPEKTRKNIEFSMKNDDNLKYFGRAKVSIHNACLGPDTVYYVEPDYLPPVVSETKQEAPTKNIPAINNYDATQKTLYMVQQAAGGISTAYISVYSPGGSIATVPQGFSINPTESEAQMQVYTVTWAGSNDKLNDTDLTITFTNKSDNKETETINLKSLASEVTDLKLTPKETGSATLSIADKKININMVEENSFSLSMNSYAGNVTVESCPSFLTPVTTSPVRAMPDKKETTLKFNLNTTVNGRTAENLVLTNPAGGPKLTLEVTPVYLAPVVSGSGDMVPANANKWEQADNTLYLVQSKAGSNSSGKLTIYSLGGSTLTLPDKSISASLAQSDEKSQSYTISWAGSDALNLTEQTKVLTFKNKSDDTKDLKINVKLLPNVISDLSIQPKTTNLGTATLAQASSSNPATVTVDIVAGNQFNIGMKAYGTSGTNNLTTVKSCPAWLTASRPAASRATPVKGNTYITFTVDGTKTDFTQANIVLANPAGGPDVTILVKPKYMKPTYKAYSALSTCSSYSSNTLNLVQMPAKQNATGTIQIYSLGGSKGQIVTARTGLSTPQTALDKTTTRNYQVNWAGSVTPLSVQASVLRIYNFDNSQYLDIPISLKNNGAIDIKTNIGAWTPSSVTMNGGQRVAAGITVPITKGKTFNFQVQSYGGVTLTNNKVNWLKVDNATPNATTALGYQTFNFTVLDINGSYTQNTITVHPRLGGPDMILTLIPDYQAPAITSGTTISGTNPNNWNSSDNIVYMVQKTSNSTAEFTVESRGGSKMSFTAYSGFSISPMSSNNFTQKYTLTWNANSGVATAQEIALDICNSSNNAKKKSIKVKLMPNSLQNVKISNQTAGITLSGVSNNTATLVMPIIKDYQFTISMDCYGGKPALKTKPAWLETISSRAAPSTYNSTFQFKLIENAANFNDTKLVFSNPSGGPDLTINIDRQFQAPTVTSGGGMSPAANNYDVNGKILNMYRTKSNVKSKARITVYSLGGSEIATPGTWCTATSTGSNGNHTKTYEISWDGSNSSVATAWSGNLDVKNVSDRNKYVRLTLKQLESAPTYSTNYGTDHVNFSGRNYGAINMNLNAHIDFVENFAEFTLRVNSPSGVTFSDDKASAVKISDFLSVTQTHTWSNSQKYDEFKVRFNCPADNGGWSLPNWQHCSSEPNLVLQNMVFTPRDNAFYPHKLKYTIIPPVFAGRIGVKIGDYYWVVDRRVKANLGNTRNYVRNLVGHGWDMVTRRQYRTILGHNENGERASRKTTFNATEFNFLFKYYPSDYRMNVYRTDDRYDGSRQRATIQEAENLFNSDEYTGDEYNNVVVAIWNRQYY